MIELFTNLLASEVSGFVEQLAPFVSEALLGHLRALAGMTRGRALSSATLHTERFRLVREWSQFFDQYPVVVGPNLGVPIWPIDADLDPKHGLALIGDAVRFSMPGNILGFPSLALPMGPRDGLPTSVLLYADLWREDLCVEAALTIEQSEARRSHSDESDSRK